MMRKLRLILACVCALGAGCRNNPMDLTGRNPLLVAPTPTPAPALFPSNFFEDFETASALPNTWVYGDSGSSVVAGPSVSAAYNGGFGMRASMTAAGWGAGFGFDSRSGLRNFSGATQMRAWLRCNTAMPGPPGNNFQLMFNESGTGANAEVWQSPGQSISAGVWTEYVLNLSSFTEDPYGEAPCNSGGTCDQPGNGNSIMELSAVKSVQLKVNGAAGTFIIDMDDVRFE